jgi:ethanolamine transporter EutH
MALFNNGFKVGGSLAMGAGIMLLAPVVAPILASALKPVAKAAIKGGMMAYGKVKEVSAEAVESIEDLAAEAKTELGQPAAKPAPKAKKAASK